MPHSSGGGFHGGGFHGGHGGHFGHGSSQYSANRYSRHAFIGAHPYVYYYHARPHFIYSNGDPRDAKPSAAWAAVIILFFVLLLPLFFILMTGFHNPKRLNTNYNTKIYIEDTEDVLSSEEYSRLKTSFISFYNLTGITPAFKSTQTSSNLEDYAYSQYIGRFADEKHWLIVYRGGYDWAFEGMQGDDTDGILTTKYTKMFNKTVYNALSNNVTIGDALVQGFDKISPTIMNSSFYMDEDILLPIVFWYVIAIPSFIFSIVNLVNTYHMKGAVKYTKECVLAKCPYCDSEYYTNTVKTCPHCGANLSEEKPQEATKQEEVKKQEDEFAIDPDEFKIDDDRF